MSAQYHSYVKSDAVLERTQALANSYESNSNAEELKAAALNDLEIESIRNQHKSAAKMEALSYAHRITVAEKRFRTLNSSAEKLFRFMVELALEIRVASHLKEIMYQYRNMSTSSVILSLFLFLFSQKY